MSKAPEVAVRSEQATEVRASKAPQEVSAPRVDSNAANVTLSDLASKQVSTQAPVIEQKPPTKKEADAFQAAAEDKLSQRLEQALNTVAGTKVSFGVEKVTQGDSGDINFRVVDKDTGETVREFPPESLYSFEKALANNSETGLLVDVVS